MQAEAAEQPIVSIRNLKTHFKSGIGKNKLIVRAVDDVSFDIHKGEVFGLVGESGCGKTTTGRTIIRLYEPTDGEIYFKGERIGAGLEGIKKEIKRTKKRYSRQISTVNKEMKEELGKVSDDKKEDIRKEYREKVETLQKERSDKIAGLKKEREKRKEDNTDRKKELMKKMQMIFQDPIASLNPRMTVKEIIAEGLRITGEKKEKIITKKVNDVLETVGLLPEHANRYPHEFSGGQRQRIGVARSLVINPEFIIADEPISALDVSIQAQVINLLNDLRQELGLTIMFIAHDLSVIKYFSDRIGVMYYGKLVELANKSELFKNPLHPYTRSLLSAVPQPDPRFEKTRQRIEYRPAEEHDYTEDKPGLHEIKEGHWVHANAKELEEYKKRLKD